MLFDGENVEFQVIERREVSLLQLWLLAAGDLSQERQARLNGDIGTFGIRVEGYRSFDDERSAQMLFDIIAPYIVDSLLLAFEPPRPTPDVDVSFEGWKPGSIEILIAFGGVAAGVFKFFKSYSQFRKGVAMFIKDLTDHGPAILREVRRILRADDPEVFHDH